MAQTDQRITRRSALLAGAASIAASAVSSTHAAASLNLVSSADRLRAFMLMRAALDDQLVIGFISGRYYGVVDDEIKPLYGVVSATFSRYRLRADGGYDGASYEVPFFTDLETGVALDHWRNPYTGQEVAVPFFAFPPAALIITPELEIVVPKKPPGLSMRNQVISTQIVDQDIWFTEVTTSSMTNPEASRPIRYSEIVTLHAATAELAIRSIKRVACQTNFTSVVSWRPWLQMGERPGHLMGNGVGGYGVSLDMLPPNWLAATAARRPDVLKDPAQPLANILASKV
jgi:Protein of unknown function (DUF1838)